MAKTRQQKEIAAKDYVKKLKESKSVIFANFNGLKVKEIEELRKKCRQENVDYIITKKTLIKLAFKEVGINDVDPKKLENSIASVFGKTDEVAPAKIIGEFSKTHEALKPVGGILENKFIDKAKVVELAKLPSRQELLAKVVGTIQAPISGFVNALAGNIRNFVYVLNAVKETKK